MSSEECNTMAQRHEDTKREDIRIKSTSKRLGLLVSFGAYCINFLVSLSFRVSVFNWVEVLKEVQYEVF